MPPLRVELSVGVEEPRFGKTKVGEKVLTIASDVYRMLEVKAQQW